MRRSLRRRMARLAVVALLVAGAVAARRLLGIEWSVEALRDLVDRLGLWGPLGYVLLVAFRTPLLLPSQVVLLTGGLLFGVAGGTLWGAAGLVVSGLMAFGLTRWLAGAALEERVPPGMRRTLEVAGTRGGAAILALATAYPVGALALYHAAAGLTRMRFLVFAIALAAGAVPRAWTYAYFGSSLVEGRWLHVAIATGILAAALLPLLHPRVRHFLRGQLTFQPPPGGPEAPRPHGGRLSETAHPSDTGGDEG